MAISPLISSIIYKLKILLFPSSFLPQVFLPILLLWFVIAWFHHYEKLGTLKQKKLKYSVLLAQLWNVFEKYGEMMSNVKCQIAAFIQNGKLPNMVLKTVLRFSNIQLWRFQPYWTCSIALWLLAPRDRTSLHSNRTLQFKKESGQRRKMEKEEKWTKKKSVFVFTTW